MVVNLEDPHKLVANLEVLHKQEDLLEAHHKLEVKPLFCELQMKSATFLF